MNTALRTSSGSLKMTDWTCQCVHLLCHLGTSVRKVIFKSKVYSLFIRQCFAKPRNRPAIGIGIKKVTSLIGF